MTLITRLSRKFREINARYDGRRMKLSPTMRFTLLLLRAYLLLLVCLMVYSFATKLA